MEWIGILLATAPVVVFLALLILMDSFKLVPLRAVLGSLLAGCLAAGAALLANTWILDHSGMELRHFRRYAAPVVEEVVKAAYVVWLIRGRRLGFVVDAAIHGFGAGAGFALVENVHYMRTLPDSSLLLWVVRGFGTAVTHGSTTAIFATISQGLSERHSSRAPAIFLPGLVAAAGIHSLFNHFVLPPLVMTAVLLVVLPLLFVVVFERSEKATRSWLGTGFDSQLALLETLDGGDVRETRVGMHLRSLRDHFPPLVVADMLNYLHLHLELSMRAKTQLMAREAGARLELDDDVRADLEELRYLERSIGTTGKLALQPFLGMSSRDLWQLYLLRR